MPPGCHQLRLCGSLFDIFSVTLQALAARQASQPSAAPNEQKDTQSQHLGLVIKRDHFSLQTLAQAGDARDMAPDAKILPRSRSRHLLHQETGAPALRESDATA